MTRTTISITPAEELKKATQGGVAQIGLVPHMRIHLLQPPLHLSGNSARNERLGKRMIAHQIGEEVPTVLLGPDEKTLLYGIVEIVGDAGADSLLRRLWRIAKCLFEERPLSADIPVESHRESGSDRADKKRPQFGRNTVDDGVEMIEHQGQGKHLHAIAPGHHRKDGVKNQSVFQRVEDYPVSQRMLEDVIITVRKEFSLVASHNAKYLT